MAELDSLIGCKISLISHQDIRYDGTLFSINQAESSIVLKDVQCFGTEDRVAEKEKIIPASPAVIPFVTFPGQEIKDLYVHETTTPPPAPTAAPANPINNQSTVPPPAPVQEKSAPVAVNNNAASNNNNNNNRPPQNRNNNNNNQRRPPVDNREKKEEQQRAPTNSNNNNNKRENNTNNNNNNSNNNNVKRDQQPTTTAGTGSHLLKMREKKVGATGTGEKSADAVGEFDFQESLKSFAKDEIFAKVAADGETTTTNNNAVKYAKDDFFDNLNVDRSDGGRLTASEERHLNQDTFGAIALQNFRRGRGGGRGRGGRGSGRGNNNGNGRGRGNGRGYQRRDNNTQGQATKA